MKQILTQVPDRYKNLLSHLMAQIDISANKITNKKTHTHTRKKHPRKMFIYKNSNFIQPKVLQVYISFKNNVQRTC